MSETERDYAANYRKPPRHTRFKKGQQHRDKGQYQTHRQRAPAPSPISRAAAARAVRRASGRAIAGTAGVSPACGPEARIPKIPTEPCARSSPECR